GVRRSCEAAATRPRRASSTWRRIRSSIVWRTARPVATAAAITATTTATSWVNPIWLGIATAAAPARKAAAAISDARVIPRLTRHPSWLEPVADAPDRLDEARFGGVVVELGAQPADVDGDGRGVVEPGLAPDRLHHLVGGEDAAGGLGEEREQVQLPHRQHDLLAVEKDAAARGLDPQRAVDDRRLVLDRRRRGPA